MLRAVLFDLDDTLLEIDMDAFLAQYFELLGRNAAAFMDPKQFVTALTGSVQALLQGEGRQERNDVVFWRHFEQRVGRQRAELEQFFADFYATQFEQLRALTQPIAGARELIDYCFEQRWSVVIATNPVFPKAAIDARLRWAGLGSLTTPFDLVTSIETVHATKPRVEYYAEILERVGCSPNQALMVGDDRVRDIEPATRLGLHTFEVATARKQQAASQRYGSLPQLLLALKQGTLLT